MTTVVGRSFLLGEDILCDTFLAMHIAVFSCYAYTKNDAFRETKCHYIPWFDIGAQQGS